MRPALLVPLVLAGIVALPLARPVEACMCMPATLPSLFSGSSDAFTGRVVSVHRRAADVLVRIEAERVYKGRTTPGTVVTLWMYDGFIGDKQTPARIGQRWMVFASPYAWTQARSEPRWRYLPDLSTGSCSGNWRITAKYPAPEPEALATPVPSPQVQLLPPLPSPPPPVLP